MASGWEIGLIVTLSILVVLCLLCVVLYWCGREKKGEEVIIPTIQFDQKGFSSNELSILNLKSVRNGCGIDTARVEEMGSIVVITPEALQLPAAGPEPAMAASSATQRTSVMTIASTVTSRSVLGGSKNKPSELLKVTSIDEYLDFTNMENYPGDTMPASQPTQQASQPR